jgi:hypothetical protein
MGGLAANLGYSPKVRSAVTQKRRQGASVEQSRVVWPPQGYSQSLAPALRNREHSLLKTPATTILHKTCQCIVIRSCYSCIVQLCAPAHPEERAQFAGQAPSPGIEQSSYIVLCLCVSPLPCLALWRDEKVRAYTQMLAKLFPQCAQHSKGLYFAWYCLKTSSAYLLDFSLRWAVVAAPS